MVTKKTGEYWNCLAQKATTDSDAFSELYDHFFPRVYNFIFAKLKNAAESDDVVSVTFQKMYEHLPLYNSQKAAFSTWLFRIASNCLVDFTRKSGNNRETSWDDTFDPMAPDKDEPEEQILRIEKNKELLLAVGKLSEREQRIIALKFWSGLSNKEIAEIMDLGYSNVGTILGRALNTLRKYVKK